MERGGSEEEAGSPAGEHNEPHELLRQNMDSKTLHLYAKAQHDLKPPPPQCFTVTGLSCTIIMSLSQLCTQPCMTGRSM